MLRRVFIASAALFVLLQPASAATTIRFVTDWKAQAEHGGFYQAVADGLYAQRGLDVKITQGGPAVNVPQLLAGGAADFGIGREDIVVDPARRHVRDLGRVVATGADESDVLDHLQRDRGGGPSRPLFFNSYLSSKRRSKQSI